MRFTTFMMIFLTMFGASLSFHKEKISKVICSLSRNEHAGLLKEASLNKIKSIKQKIPG